MAPLKVIGAGLSRTGTMSLRDALNILGYQTFHGVNFSFDTTRDLSIFYDAFYHPDKELDWDGYYDGFDAALDMPTAAFVGPLTKKYPDAKVILVERDFDRWYESLEKTLYVIFCLSDPPTEPRVRKVYDFCKSEVNMGGIFKDKESFQDKEKVRSVYEKHNEWVKTNIPAHKLLIMKLGEGWERLCQFLGKPVPDIPFPHANSTDEFQRLYHDKDLAEYVDAADLVGAKQ